MKIEDVFIPHYEYYLKHFNAILKDIKKSESGVAEVLLDTNLEGIDEIYRLYRADFLTANHEIVEINTEGYINHEPQEFYYDDINVIIYPFLWNGCEIYLNTRPSNWIFLDEWAYKWIKRDDSELKTNDFNVGAIHKIEIPNSKDGWVMLAIDLGTAPPEALVELVELILSDGFVKGLEIGSPAMIED